MLTATTSLPLSRTLFWGNTTSFAYDEAARLTGLTDSKGNTISYVYDALGRVAKVTNALGKTMEYSYDETGNLTQSKEYDGNRLSKTVNESSTTYYVNDTSGSLTQVVAETDKDGKETASYKGRRYWKCILVNDVRPND